MSAPSVGRIVHFTDYDGSCRAAIVTGVPHAEGSETVDLMVFMKTVPEPREGVAYAEPVSATSTWHWPERV